MRRKVFLSAALAVVLTAATVVPAQAAMAGAPANDVTIGNSVPISKVVTVEQMRQVILDQTNAARKNNGLAPLTLSTKITSVAQAWTVKQASANAMSHNPSYSTQIPSGWRWAGENVAEGFDYSNVVEGWLTSPGHYKNIMNDKATHIGIGIAFSSSDRAYFTQNFAAYSSDPDGGAAPAAAAPSATTTSRLYGSDRYATAGKILDKWSSAGTLYIASGAVFPDALSASAIAGHTNDPVMIVPPTGLTSNLLASAKRLNPKRIVIMGGTGAVSDHVVKQLRKSLPNASYTRIAGADRYQTAQQAVDKLWSGSVRHVYLAVGSNFPDALAAAPAAITQGAAIIPVKGSQPGKELLALLKKKGVAKITIVGSTGVIPSSFADTLKSSGYSVTRIGGADRYATAEAIAKSVFPGSQSTTYLATGANFADALAAAALAGKQHAPLLLSRSSCLPGGTAAYLRSSNTKQAILLGGPAIISTAVEKHLASC